MTQPADPTPPSPAGTDDNDDESAAIEARAIAANKAHRQAAVSRRAVDAAAAAVDTARAALDAAKAAHAADYDALTGAMAALSALLGDELPALPPADAATGAPATPGPTPAAAPAPGS
jgi:outer membrane protein TolC